MHKIYFIIIVIDFLLLSCSNLKEILPPPPNTSVEQVNNCTDRTDNELKVTEILTKITKDVNETGVVPPTKDWGYSLESEKEQNLIIQHSDNLCVWLIDPWSEEKLIKPNESNLIKKGAYLLHIIGQKENQEFSFSLELKAKALFQPNPPVTKPPVSSQESQNLSQEDAKKIVSQWLEKKKSIYSKDYNLDLAREILTDPFLNQIIDEVEDLKKNNMYFVYPSYSISNIVAFEQKDDQAEITLKIRQAYQKYQDDTIVYSTEGDKFFKFTYKLRKENGTWKISDREEK